MENLKLNIMISIVLQTFEKLSRRIQVIKMFKIAKKRLTCIHLSDSVPHDSTAPSSQIFTPSNTLIGIFTPLAPMNLAVHNIDYDRRREIHLCSSSKLRNISLEGLVLKASEFSLKMNISIVIDKQTAITQLNLVFLWKRQEY